MASLIQEHFTTTKYGDDRTARRERDRRARELRAQGYLVECKRFEFTDLARCRYYTLTATTGR